MYRTEEPRRSRELEAALSALCGSLLLVRCSSGPVSVGDNRVSISEIDTGAAGQPDTGPEPGDAQPDASIDAGVDAEPGVDSDAVVDAGSEPAADVSPEATPDSGSADAKPDAPTTVGDLLGLLERDGCNDQLSSGEFKEHFSSPTATVPICRLGAAV